MKKIVSMAGATGALALALAAAPVAVPDAAPPAEATIKAFYVSKLSKAGVWVYEDYNCKLDSDYVAPGQWENSRRVAYVQSFKMPKGKRAKINGIPIPAKNKDWCFPHYGVTLVATFQFTN